MGDDHFADLAWASVAALVIEQFEDDVFLRDVQSAGRAAEGEHASVTAAVLDHDGSAEGREDRLAIGFEQHFAGYEDRFETR